VPSFSTRASQPRARISDLVNRTVLIEPPFKQGRRASCDGREPATLVVRSGEAEDRQTVGAPGWVRHVSHGGA